jgi:hypothetical protein
MSSGELQEMEVGTVQSKTAVNANAATGMPMKGVDQVDPKIPIQDLGGPTPENYSPTDDSAKLTSAGATLKQVADVVTNRKGKTGPMAAQTSATKVKEDGDVSDEEVIEEQPQTDEDQVVAEEEVVEEETAEEDAVVAEAPEYEEIDIEEDVKALLDGEELSEEFQAKAKTIFEAAIKTKVTQLKEAYAVVLEEQVNEQVAEIKAALTERVDAYLEYVSSEWVEENKLAVEGGLKEDLNDSFMTGLKSLFEEHYVTIPEDKYDVLESMVEKLDEMETKLNEQIDRNVSLNKRLAESSSDVILADVSEGLAATQKEKLASLAENVEFESEESYREKLETLKESYFVSKPVNPSAKTETLSEGAEAAPVSVSNSMAAYLKTLQSFK